MATVTLQDANRPRIDQNEATTTGEVKLIPEKTLTGIISWCLKNTQIKKPLEPRKKRKNSLLHHAAENGYLHVAEVLFSQEFEGDFDINAIGEEGKTPLEIAIENGHEKLALFLIKQGPDLSTKNDDNETVLHIAVKNGLRETVALLIEKGANINAKARLYRTPLHQAVDNEQFEIATFLVKNGSDPNSRDIFENTPLHSLSGSPNSPNFDLSLFDAMNLKVDLTKLLIEKGSHINAVNDKNETPLLNALMSALTFEENNEARFDLVKLLLSKGANSTCILQRIIQEKNCNIEVVKMLIDFNVKVDDAHSLLAAIKKGNVDLVKLLIQAGASIQPATPNKEASAPIHIAAWEGNVPIGKLLIEKGCDINFLDPNRYCSTTSTNSDTNNTALHISTKRGKIEFVKFLLKQGADAQIKNGQGKTAKEIAIKNGNIELIDLFYKTEKSSKKSKHSKHSKKSKTKMDDCIICFNPKSGIFAFIPCGHAMACENCSKNIIESSDKPECPTCRQSVTIYQKIFM